MTQPGLVESYCVLSCVFVYFWLSSVRAHMLVVFFFMYLRAQVMQALSMRRSLDQDCTVIYFIAPYGRRKESEVEKVPIRRGWELFKSRGILGHSFLQRKREKRVEKRHQAAGIRYVLLHIFQYILPYVHF